MAFALVAALACAALPPSAFAQDAASAAADEAGAPPPAETETETEEELPELPDVPEKETVKPPPAVQGGIADAGEVGKLPPITRELARRGAEAVAKKDWKVAREAYAEMLEVDPDNSLALANLGAVEFQLGMSDAARGHLERAVAVQPRLAQTWSTLGLIYYETGNGYLAVSALTRALALDETDARSHNYLGVALKEIGWINGAEQELQRAIELEPGYAEAHFNLALVYLDRKPPAAELARRHYLRAKQFGAAPDALVEKMLEAAAKAD